MTDGQLRNCLENLRHKISLDCNCPELEGKKTITAEEAEALLEDEEYRYADFENYISALLEFSERGLRFKPLSWEHKKRLALLNIDSLKKIRFESGGYPGVFRIGSHYFAKDQDAEIAINPLPEPPYPEYPVTKTAIRKLLADVHFRDWDEFYDNEYILDGHQWSLDLCFHDNAAPDIHVYGSNEYPENYDKLERFFVSV